MSGSRQLVTYMTPRLQTTNVECYVRGTPRLRSALNRTIHLYRDNAEGNEKDMPKEPLPDSGRGLSTLETSPHQ